MEPCHIHCWHSVLKTLIKVKNLENTTLICITESEFNSIGQNLGEKKYFWHNHTMYNYVKNLWHFVIHKQQFDVRFYN